MTRPSPLLLWTVGLCLGLSLDALAQEAEEATAPAEGATAPAEEAIAPTDEGSTEEAVEPTAPLPGKLSNSADRSWVLPSVRANSSKAAGLPLNVITAPVPVPLTAEEEALAAEEAALAAEEATRIAEREAREPVELPEGWYWTAATFAIAGSQMGMTYGMHWADGDGEGAAGGAAIGTLGGLAGGIGASYGLTPSRDEGAHMLAGALTGSWTGAQLARLVLDRDDKDFAERAMAWSTLGDLAGIGAAIALQDRGPSHKTTAGAMLAGTAGWQIGAGIADFADLDPQDDQRPRAAIELGVGYALGAGLGFAHHQGLSLADPVWATVGVAEGAWIGAWLPWALANQPTDRQRIGSLRVSVAGGYLLSLGVTEVLEPTPQILGLQALGFSVGTLLGTGIPLSTKIEGYPRGVVIPMLIGGVGGQIVGTLVEPRYKLTQDDALLVPTLWAWTGYQMIGWGAMASALDLSDRRTAGLVLTTAGVGTLVSWGLPAVVDLSPRQTVLTLSSSVWGTWYGAWSSYLLRADTPQTWAATLTAGDVALLGMAGATAVGFDPSWRQIGLVNAAGAAGAGFGALVGVLASPDPRTVSFSSLVGTTVGLAGGTVLAVVREPGGSKDSASTASLRSLRRPRLSKVPFTVLPMAAPYIGEDGDVGVMVQLSAIEREVGR